MPFWRLAGRGGMKQVRVTIQRGVLRQRGAMRPLLLTFLLVVTSAAIFLGIAAVGTLGLNRQQALVATAPSQADSDPDPNLTDDASPAAAKIPAEAAAKGQPPAAPLVRPRADRPDAPPPLPPPVPGPIDLPALSAV